MPRDWTGANNPRYNHGLCNYDGRTIISCRDGTLMHYYRGVMAAHIGRLLRSDEIVHHINGDPFDDRIANLEITNRADHLRHHRKEIMANIQMPKGEAHSQAKLTEKDVLAIRASSDSSTVEAKKYGMSPASIRGIRRRKTWVHV